MKPEKKDTVLIFRINQYEKRILKTKAMKENLSMAEIMRGLILQEKNKDSAELDNK